MQPDLNRKEELQVIPASERGQIHHRLGYLQKLSRWPMIADPKKVADEIVLLQMRLQLDADVRRTKMEDNSVGSTR